MFRRRKLNTPFGAFSALAFNSLLCITPMLGAQAVSTAFSTPRQVSEASEQARLATSRAIDSRLQKVARRQPGDAREVWAALVRSELEDDDVMAARGFLLAAPAMLQGDLGQSVQARAAVSDLENPEDALVEAALAYLPSDVQELYDRTNEPFVERLQIEQAAPVVEAAPGEQVVTPDGQPTSVITLAAGEDTSPRGFSMLGSTEDLARNTAAWVRGDDVDEFAIALSGVGLTLLGPEAQEGASVVLSARRAHRLDKQFEVYLQRKLFDAAPPQRIKRQLAGEFQGEYGYVTRGPHVERVFRESADLQAVASLEEDLAIVRQILQMTSPGAAVTILSNVSDGADLRRARLVTEAGGERAVSLAAHDPEAFLTAARTVIPWTDSLRFQLLAVIFCVAAMAFIAFNMVSRSVKRASPRRKSAVYGYEEYPYMS